jgi:hypothetical protein
VYGELDQYAINNERPELNSREWQIFLSSPLTLERFWIDEMIIQAENWFDGDLP